MMQTSQINEVAARVREVRERIATAALAVGREPDEITLMAVTKTVPPERVNLAFEAGVRLFGENRVQEYLDKRDFYAYCREQTHFIGHLQTNKVKVIIDKVSMLESVSSQKLAEEVDRRAGAVGLVMPILLEVNIAGEETKSGFSPNELGDALARCAELSGVEVRGFLCIPEPGRGDYYFAKIQELFENLRQTNAGRGLRLLSMGMSGDYEHAVRRGSHIVRIGSALFGARGGGVAK